MSSFTVIFIYKFPFKTALEESLKPNICFLKLSYSCPSLAALQKSLTLKGLIKSNIKLCCWNLCARDKKSVGDPFQTLMSHSH